MTPLRNVKNVIEIKRNLCHAGTTQQMPARRPGVRFERMSETPTRAISPTPPELASSEPGRRTHPVDELVARSRRLGADPRTTNYAGGNTSAKGSATDPVTGLDVDVLWVKGSGGDLGTLTEAGLAVLRLDRVRALVDTYPGVEGEDAMVAAFDHCLFGRGGATPSIDTAMHGLTEADHVDHLHPDAGIALATAADGERLTRDCFAGRVAWVPWRRPGFQLGLDVAAIHRDRPDAIGVVLGGHGITAWGDTSEACEANSLDIIRTAERYIAEHGRPEPFGPLVDGYGPLPAEARRDRAAALMPLLRGLASTDRPQVGHYTDTDVVLDFVARASLPRLAELGTSCPDHFLRTKVRPLVLDLPGTAPLAEVEARMRALHVEYRDGYRAYYERYATPDSPPMRGADPAIVLVPGIGMFSFGATKQTARVAGEFYVNAINVMRGAEALSTYDPIPESEKFRIEYWSLEEAKIARQPRPKPLATRVAFVTGGGSGIGRAIALRLAEEGACVAVADIEAANAESVAREIGGPDAAAAIVCDVTDEAQVAAAFRDAVLTFGGVDIVVNNAGLSISKSLFDTTVDDWDLQHDVMARGSFLVSREAARIMRDQAMGGDLVYVVSKNAFFAGPNNVAYGASKADQAHQVRLLAAELGEFGIRVNGVNPDGVVRGSGIFAKGWGADRARTYGVPEDKLGEFYAQRTLLKKEVLPEHVAAAVFALVGGDLSQTTGLHIPVDAGVAAAFLR
jgi:rhamnulose-1-phosphate aldolase/alcohol dehydrogenase